LALKVLKSNKKLFKQIFLMLLSFVRKLRPKPVPGGQYPDVPGGAARPVPDQGRKLPRHSRPPRQPGRAAFQPGLPNFSWYNIPKREICTKLPQNIPNINDRPLQDPPKITQILILV
jgi:hypothetical protein